METLNTQVSSAVPQHGQGAATATANLRTKHLRQVLKVLGFALAAVAGVITLAIIVLSVVYTPEYLYRREVWKDSKVSTYLQQFPSHPLTAAPAPSPLKVSPDARVSQLFAQLAGTSDWNTFLAENQTQAFIVIQNGTVRYENYFNGSKRDSMVTSFSVAKSFTSALIGRAIQDGYIKSVNDPITNYLPELAQRDPRFKSITIRNLLMMASGLDYQAKRPLPWDSGGTLNGDDTLTTYYPDQRKLALTNTHIIDPPGLYFRYNKYHPQLLGLILERTTGMSVTHYLQTRFWDPLGMEYAGSWSIDSQSSGFEKMETGVNARAIDFARFGELFLNGGSWNGKQILSKAWVDESTRPYLPGHNTTYYPDYFLTSFGSIRYAYMWCDLVQADGSYDFYAEGDHGQFIYVSPQKHLVIVRNGVEYYQDWVKLFSDFAKQY